MNTIDFVTLCMVIHSDKIMQVLGQDHSNTVIVITRPKVIAKVIISHFQSHVRKSTHPHGTEPSVCLKSEKSHHSIIYCLLNSLEHQTLYNLIKYISKTNQLN